jgi:hypothetical protein
MPKRKPPIKLSYQCFVCKRGIRSNDKLKCTVMIERGISESGSKPIPRQFVYAHGKCLVRLIPPTGYSFPELFKAKRVRL